MKGRHYDFLAKPEQEKIVEQGLLAALWASVWAENSPSGRSIILLIAVLGLVAFRRWWQHNERFRWEDRQLKAVSEQLKVLRPSSPQQRSETESAEALTGNEGDSDEERDADESDGHVDKDFVSDHLAAPVDAIRLREAAHAGSLIYERLEAIDRLRRQHVRVNLRTLQGLSRARIAARPGLDTPARAASMAMMFGILGTFIGLAAMAQDIQWALPISDGEPLPGVDPLIRSFQNVGAVMVGIKTAFSSSMVGMATAILLTVLGHRLRDRQAVFFEELERFTVEDLLPATVPPLEGKDLLERVSLKMENSFDRLREVFTSNQDMLESLNGVQESYLEILDGIRAIHRTDGAKQLDEVVAGLGHTHRSVLEVVETLPRIARAIETSQQRFLERLRPSQQIITGLANLWTARLFGKVPGSLVMVLLFLACLYWLFLQFRTFF